MVVHIEFDLHLTDAGASELFSTPEWELKDNILKGLKLSPRDVFLIRNFEMDEI